MRFFPSIIPTEAHSSHDYHPRTGEDPASSALLGEAIMDSVSSVRDSLPKEHRAHFETLRQEIIDFTKAHGIPKESLGKPDLLREATCKLSTSDLERLANLLERFEYLVKHKELMKEDYTEALEYVEKYYHLKKQYDSQVSLLEQVGILHPKKRSKHIQKLSTFFRSLLPYGKKKRPEVSTVPETPEILCITGIDDNEYPIPTLEQIASRLFERRETLKTKHDQGFTKLLLVPFGMSLDSLQETFEQFLLKYKKDNPTFDLDTRMPLFTWEKYQGADMGDSPDLVYYPQSFTREGHGGRTKAQILKEQTEGRWTPASAGVSGENGLGTPGWTVHLLQPSNLDEQDTETPKGFAPIPRQGQGTPQGDLIPRPPLETGQSPIEYLSIFQGAQDDGNSPYSQESGMTPEDWIIAFMIHLTETGKPLDNWENGIESVSNLTGAFFQSCIDVPCVSWGRVGRRANLGVGDPHARGGNVGLRSSVVV